MFPLAHGIKGISFLNRKLVKFHLADERGTQINLSLSSLKTQGHFRAKQPGCLQRELVIFTWILTTSRSEEENDTARSCLEKILARKGWGTCSFYSPWTEHRCDGVALQQRQHYLICWRHSTAEAKQASFVVGKTWVRRMIVREERHLLPQENEGTRGRTQFAGESQH